ncbi:riboflavin kinase [Bifidobacterium magnum]|uniref:Riboflavin kinase/FMN adenylyltransferase n=1 Tax=Bifidobacterium magnum TaxID=1692 RepID=A0A087BBH1_9BIFI|nr:riboflavin kinase [Bifidobacterium magnum]KFI68371.1 Riboflavin kinase/FMN adenylyltransferase [Bifidobacterium magnum]
MNLIEITPDESGNIDWPLLSTDKKSVVTVGSFDGMHRGHRAVVSTVAQLAKQQHAFSVVIMFDERPAFVHQYAAEHGGAQVPEDMVDEDRISGLSQRLRVMNEIGVDYVLLVHYTLEFADKSFRFFIGQLVGKLGMRTLVLGADAAMGAGRAGTVEAIDLLAQATGMFELVLVDDKGNGATRVPRTIEPRMPKNADDATDMRQSMNKAEFRSWSKKIQSREVRNWSSSNVRFLLSQAAIREANEILGAAHGVEGVVTHGEERGSTLGFPTANVDTPFDGYLPVDGVYAGWLVDLGPAESYDPKTGSVMITDEEHAAHTDDGAHNAAISQQYHGGSVKSRLAPESPFRWKAAISIGAKPTFSDQTGRNDRTLEAYALTDDWIDLYGHRVRVEFESFLRPQIKFDSKDELVAQLERDKKTVDELLK